MKFSTIFISALVSLAYGAPYQGVESVSEQRQQQQEQAMSGVEGSVTNHQQVIDTLNERLRADGGVHANQERITAGGMSKAIGNFLLGPFVQSVTNGAEVLLANMIGGTADRMDAAMVGQLTGNYSRLIKLSSENNVDVSKLQNLNQEISKSVN